MADKLEDSANVRGTFAAPLTQPSGITGQLGIDEIIGSQMGEMNQMAEAQQPWDEVRNAIQTNKERTKNLQENSDWQNLSPGHWSMTDYQGIKKVYEPGEGLRMEVNNEVQKVPSGLGGNFRPHSDWEEDAPQTPWDKPLEMVKALYKPKEELADGVQAPTQDQKKLVIEMALIAALSKLAHDGVPLKVNEGQLASAIASAIDRQTTA